MRLVFLGPPGAGKGTQAVRLAAEWGVPHISTGDILRAAAASGTPLGGQVHSYLEAGELVPDKVMNAVVAHRLSQPGCARGFLLDGFPRTNSQAEALDEILREQDRKLDMVLYVDVARDELIRRLAGRRVCTDCGANYNVSDVSPEETDRCLQCGGTLEQRADDQPETVAIRLEVYHKTTAPLVGYYRQAGLLRQIGGLGSPEEVYQRIVDVVEPVP